MEKVQRLSRKRVGLSNPKYKTSNYSNGFSMSNVSSINNYRQYIKQKINHLTILDFIYTPNHPKKHLKYQFKVQCDCGFIDLKKCNAIINNKIQTCGRYECPFRINSSSAAIEKYKTYIGQKINHLTIIDVFYDYNDNNNHRFKFKVKCDCGFENLLDIHSVLANKYKTCGFINCKYSKTEIAINKYKNMIGNKINKLTIIDFIYDQTQPEQYYRWKFKCSCECGNTEYYLAVDELLYRTPDCCDKCFSISNFEVLFNNWIIELNIDYIHHKRIYLKNEEQKFIEIDFLIGSIGIELNGLITHSSSEYNNKFGRTLSQNYHLNKLEIASKHNIDLLQFWNFEFFQKEDIVKSIILNKLNKTPYKEYARNCYIKQIDKDVSDQFLINNHIQGTVKSDSIRLGLFYKKNNNLIAVMTFGKSRYSNHEWELYRFASLVYCNIIGGASKLFKYFLNKYDPNSIVSYSDRRIFNTGRLYEILGFKLDHVSKPDYWYFKHNRNDKYQILYHRSMFMKHKLIDKLDAFDPNLTEVQNMENNGYLRVFDCGNKVYIWKK